MRSVDGEQFCYWIVLLKGLALSLLGVWVAFGLVVFNSRCGILLDPGMANMWRRGGERRHDSPDGRKVLSLVSVYGPVSGAGCDDERRITFHSVFAMLGFLPERSVSFVGGDFNAEIAFRGVGEESIDPRYLRRELRVVVFFSPGV